MNDFCQKKHETRNLGTKPPATKHENSRLSSEHSRYFVEQAFLPVVFAVDRQECLSYPWLFSK